MASKIIGGVAVVVLVALAAFSTQTSSFLISNTYSTNEIVDERVSVSLDSVVSPSDTYYTRWTVENESQVVDSSDWREINSSSIKKNGIRLGNTYTGAKTNLTVTNEMQSEITGNHIYRNTGVEKLRLEYRGNIENATIKSLKLEKSPESKIVIPIGESETVGNSLNQINIDVPVYIDFNDAMISSVGIDSDDSDQNIDENREANYWDIQVDQIGRESTTSSGEEDGEDSDSSTTGETVEEEIQISMSGNLNLKANDSVIIKINGINPLGGYESTSRVNSVANLTAAHVEEDGSIHNKENCVNSIKKVSENKVDFEIENRCIVVDRHDKLHISYNGVSNPHDSGLYQVQSSVYSDSSRIIRDYMPVRVNPLTEQRQFTRTFDNPGVKYYKLQIADENKDVISVGLHEFKIYEPGNAPEAYSELESFFNNNFLSGLFSWLG